MANYRVAKRYAKGLYDFSKSENNTKEIYLEMKDLLVLLQDSTDLKNFFKSPILDYKKKQSIAQKIFTSYSSTTQKFIQLVISRGRETNLTEIAKQFLTLVDIDNKIQKITITSATEIDDNTISKILENSNLVNDIKAVNLIKKINPTLIGGYILKVGDQQLDASIKNKINTLKNNFNNNQYIPKF